MKTLINELAEVGIIQLVPITFNKYTGNHNIFDNEYIVDNDFEDTTEPDSWTTEEDDYNQFEEIEENEDSIYIEDRPENLEELKSSLGFDFMENEEFLTLSIADLFGLTKNQLKFINIDMLLTGDIYAFIAYMNDRTIISDIPDVQQRIKYAIICSTTDVIKNIKLPTKYLSSGIKEFAINIGFNVDSINYQTPENKEKLDKYIKRLIFTHNEEDSKELLTLLSDYYNLFSNGLIVNQERINNHESPVIYELFPHFNKIREYHNKAMRDFNYINNKIETKHIKTLNKQIKFTTDLAMYKQFLYSNNDFSIVGVKNYEDLLKEGSFLNHCVADYADRFSQGQTYIYFLRQNSNKDTPYFTLEVLPEGLYSYKLNQCYTFDDTIDKSSECKKFIIDWATKHKIKINCQL